MRRRRRKEERKMRRKNLPILWILDLGHIGQNAKFWILVRTANSFKGAIWFSLLTKPAKSSGRTEFHNCTFCPQ